jgi:hypothetical protein
MTGEKEKGRKKTEKDNAETQRFRREEKERRERLNTEFTKEAQRYREPSLELDYAEAALDPA